ncbi:MAG: xanthan lyase [Bacteroidaceae bacterium]
MKKIVFFLLLVSVVGLNDTSAQSLGKIYKDSIASYLSSYMNDLLVGKPKVTSIRVNSSRKTVRVSLNNQCSYIPFRQGNVATIYKDVAAILPAKYRSYKLTIFAQRKPIEQLVPGALSKHFQQKNKIPLIRSLSRRYQPTKGLLNRHIALWQSHGFYYEQSLSRWEFQRARVFQTVEDLYTQSYVVPFLVPMLEKAGANVFMPRERDWQTHEIIVDNDPGVDSGDSYRETNGAQQWKRGDGAGFAHKRWTYTTQNPFQEGTYRQIATTKATQKTATVSWAFKVPVAGEYGVYISYKSLPNSTKDAHYTVYYKGGKSEFKVNQTMGGGTWIYLGRFAFDASSTDKARVELTNASAEEGRVLTADAVKIGGGYGNIARSSAISPAEVSGYPRFTEAARYWMQWAGVPSTVYSITEGESDYKDDYKSRGEWVNYMAGGSSALSKEEGLHIPIDLAFAFHSDAGTTPNDSIIGTLAIYNTDGNKKFENGSSRYLSRNLADMVQTQIVNDIRRCYEPIWSRRGLWNKAYSEASTPKVPTMLLELLSHHNFADMRYGLDPNFRFSVARSIYKGMLRYLSMQYNQPYVVQPLPVDHMQLQFVNSGQVKLSWQPVVDTLEATANPTSYIVYTRVGKEGAFNQGEVCKGTSLVLTQLPGVSYSYKVTAVNDGGESFPSEILSAYRAIDEKGVACIVNGFDRLSAPTSMVYSDTYAGFNDADDHGVPYIYDISYCGSQYEWNRDVPWTDDDAPGFGTSRSNYETKVIAGNTFDYPIIHGSSIAKTGYSYVSCSDESVEDGMVSLAPYRFVDLILGKEKETVIARGVKAPRYKTFTADMIKRLTAYCNGGGNLLVSGAYIGTDLCDKKEPVASDVSFLKNILKFSWRTNHAAIVGDVKCVNSPFASFKGRFSYQDKLSDKCYVVESPDAIEPVKKTPNNYTIMRYAVNNLSAAVAYRGAYHTVTMGFPFETIKEDTARDVLMQQIVSFFSSSNTPKQNKSIPKNKYKNKK